MPFKSFLDENSAFWESQKQDCVLYSRKSSPYVRSLYGPWFISLAELLSNSSVTRKERMVNSWDARTVRVKGPFTFAYAHTSFSLMPTLKPGFMAAHPQILFCGAVRSHQLHLRSLERTPQLVSLGPALRASGRRGSRKKSSGTFWYIPLRKECFSAL